MDDIIVVVRFTDLGAARRALQKLEQLDRDGRLRVSGAALLERTGEREAGVPRGTQDEEGYFMPVGGTVGMLVDAVTGPVGTLFSRPTTGFRGHGDRSHEDEWPVVLEDISRSLGPGVKIVIAQIDDPDPAVLEAALDELGGSVTQRPAYDVYAELQAADAAEERAAQEARRVLREQRRTESKEQWERFKDSVKSKLP
jgi:hypothetical protein